MKSYKIGLVGCGTVGQGFMDILVRKAAALKKQYGFEAKIVAIADMHKGNLIAPQGIDLKKTLAALAAGKTLHAVDPKAAKYDGWKAVDVIAATKADIIAELTFTDIKTGEPATSHIRRALETGKHVVTSNKGPAALHYGELKALADRKKLLFRIEGTVMSGTPVFTLCRARLRRERDPGGPRDPERDHELHPEPDGARQPGLRRRPGPGPEAGIRRGRSRQPTSRPGRPGQGRHPGSNVLMEAGLKPAASITPAGIGGINKAMIASAAAPRATATSSSPTPGTRAPGSRPG